jgi:Ca2+-binding RTX toxin-like protein
VNPVADAPNLTVSAATGSEDTAIALSISTSATDSSETLSVLISGVPTGATLSAGTNSNGTWTLTPAQLSGLTITPPANSDADFTLTVVSTSTDGAVSASTSQTLAVTVAGVADQPNLTVSAATGSEDQEIALSIAASLADTDGSEALSLRITGVPTGASLSAGTKNGDGSWTLTPAQLSGLTLTPPENSDADFSLTVTATSTDGASSATLAVTVDAEADTPTLEGADTSTQEDTPVTLTLTHALADSSETLSLRITTPQAIGGLAGAVSVSPGTWSVTPASGVTTTLLTLTPAPQSDMDVTLLVRAIATDGASSADTEREIVVTVDPVTDTPTLSLTPATVGEDGIVSPVIVTTTADKDGSETVSYRVSGIPSSAALLSQGSDLGGGSWQFTAAQMATLSLRPAVRDADLTLGVTAYVSETDSVELTAEGILPISGARLASTLTGDSGANVLNGLRGDDTLRGGGGNDILDGGFDIDTADYGYVVSQALSVTLNSATTVTVTVAAGTDVDLLIGMENLIGGALGDQLTGDGGGNRLAGGDGNDVLSGGAGSDFLLGQLGDDILFGDADGDTLEGGAGNDTLSGGAGSDRFRFDTDALSGADVIKDLASGDVIDLDALLSSLAGAGASSTAREAFVQFNGPLGGGVEIWIDRDGTGSTGQISLLAVIENQASVEIVRQQTSLGGAGG